MTALRDLKLVCLAPEARYDWRAHVPRLLSVYAAHVG